MISVYKLTCKVNGKIYIGVTRHPAARMAEHRYQMRQGSQLPLYCAMRKYGLDTFEMTILDQVEDRDYAFNILEPRLIAEHGSNVRGVGYNITNGGEGLKRSIGYKHTDEAKNKIRMALLGKKKTQEIRNNMKVAKRKPEAIERMRTLMTGNQRSVGYHHTDEAKQAIREAHTGKVFSEETRMKMSIAAKNRAVRKVSIGV